MRARSGAAWPGPRLGLLALAVYAAVEGVAEGTVGAADIVLGAGGVVAGSVIGGAFAFAVGAMVGALLALVDVALLTAARVVAGGPEARS